MNPIGAFYGGIGLCNQKKLGWPLLSWDNSNISGAVSIFTDNYHWSTDSCMFSTILEHSLLLVFSTQKYFENEKM